MGEPRRMADWLLWEVTTSERPTPYDAHAGGESWDGFVPRRRGTCRTSLPALDRRVLDLVDGKTTLPCIAEIASLSVRETYVILLRLEHAGLVDLRPESGAYRAVTGIVPNDE